MHTFDVVLAFLVGVFVVLKFVGEYAEMKKVVEEKLRLFGSIGRVQ